MVTKDIKGKLTQENLQVNFQNCSLREEFCLRLKSLKWKTISLHEIQKNLVCLMLIKKSIKRNFKFKLKPETNLIRQREASLFVMKYLFFSESLLIFQELSLNFTDDVC